MFNALLKLLSGTKPQPTKYNPKLTLKFCSYSNSIRQWPQNYIIAHWTVGGWVCEPDLAANMTLCVSTFKDLMKYENKYERDGNKLLARLSIVSL